MSTEGYVRRIRCTHRGCDVAYEAPGISTSMNELCHLAAGAGWTTWLTHPGRTRNDIGAALCPEHTARTAKRKEEALAGEK